jgi:outer membrane PBP1 activator LpoA protein
MLIQRLTGLIAAAALALLAGCAAPCGANGGLCAPAQPNTSEAAAQPAASEPSPGAQGGAAGPQTSAGPAAAPGNPIRIALLLPLNSESLGPPAQAVHDGFMAAWEVDPAGIEVDLVATGDTPQEALEAYAGAAAQDDLVVGPLSRTAVGALAGIKLTRPTLALNRPESRDQLPRAMLLVGLSIEDEAHQVAQWAAHDFPQGRALVLTGPVAWQQRLATAFDGRWTQLGLSSQRVELPIASGFVSPDAIVELKARLEADPPALLFAALDADQLRQLRAAIGTAIPCYGTSSANPGHAPDAAVPELDGLRLLDLPWEVQPTDPVVAAYPRRAENTHAPDLDRLYALGIDAYRVARELALRRGAPFTLDGVTGRLAVDSGAASFTRTEAQVEYHDGLFEPVAGGH